jgi:hypothetical protein
MMEFQDIFADPLTTKFFVDASIVLLLVMALVGVWFCRPTGHRPSEPKINRLASDRDR